MRYSKSMIEAVKQVGLYEMLDYAIIDGDNKIIGLYKGNMAKKQAQLNMKGAERQVGVKKPLKIMPVSKKKVGDTIIGIGELTDKQRGEIEEDRKNALAGFDNRIKDGGMDRKDFIKAKELYKRKDIKGLRKHIYSLDTSPLEVVMNLVSIQDRPFFDKMYPNTRGGEFLAKIAYDHRKLDENLDENKDDEKKRMKGAKLRLKMGESLDEAVADLFVKKGDVNKIAVKIAKSAKGLGLKSGVMGNQVRVKGSQKNVNDFMRAVIGKSSLGGPSEVGASNPQIDKMLDKQLKEETLDEKLKFTHAVLEPDGNVLGFSSNERDAKDMARNNLRNVKGKVVTLKKPMAQRKGDKMIGYPLKEEVELDEQFDYVLLDKDNKIIARYKGRDAKKQAELNKKGAEKKLGVKKPIKVYPIRPTDKKKIGDTVLAIGEAKLIDKPTGEVLKTGSKKEMETERKRNRDELQVKEWFKSKGIDVTIRKLDDATQAYVRIGKIIPNEIREDLVKIQYGELPEDIKNTNNIVYGNFKENSVTMNNEFWKKVFEARKDDPSQEQDTNIIMQLRKSVSLKGMKDVEFNDGKKVKVKPQIATAVMDKFDTYRTTDQKLKFQQKIAKSYKDLLSALKEK